MILRIYLLSYIYVTTSQMNIFTYLLKFWNFRITCNICELYFFIVDLPTQHRGRQLWEMLRWLLWRRHTRVPVRLSTVSLSSDTGAQSVSILWHPPSPPLVTIATPHEGHRPTVNRVIVLWHRHPISEYLVTRPIPLRLLRVKRLQNFVNVYTEGIKRNAPFRRFS